jgi:phosphoribosyl 1,2-cyclic phosphodiesterase
MKFYILASGSKGNATLVVSKTLIFLIDFGLTKSRMMECLTKTPYRLEDIAFVLFTHEHSDHVQGKDCVPLERRYATARTMAVIPQNVVQHYQTFYIQHLTITPLPLSHDAKDGVGYVIDDGEESLVYMTDTGYISERNIPYMKNKHYYILESNHDVKMLLQTNRSHDLKMRILGDNGHLSNEDSAMFFSEMIGDNTKAVYLAHISEEANSPEVAKSSFVRMLKKVRAKFSADQVHLTQQWDVVIGGD